MNETLRGQPPVTDVLAELERLRGDLAERTVARRSDWVHRFGVGRRRVDLDNLAAYLELRHHDLRELQENLSALGLSSLGRSEPHVLSGLDAVLHALRVLAGDPDAAAPVQPGMTVAEARDRARDRIGATRTELFGEPTTGRSTRILVTLPAEAADDASMVERLVRSGADSVRVNAAHDDADTWAALAAHTRAAAAAVGRRIPVLIDLAGPKLRVGPVTPGPPMVRIKPRRDPWGLVVEPASVVLDGAGGPGGPGRLAVDRSWLDRVEVGDEVRLRDMRGRSRRLRVVARVGGLVHTECENGCFFSEGLELSRFRDGREVGDSTRVGPITASPGEFRVHVGETFVMVRGTEPGTDALRDEDGKLVEPARISCAEPAVVDLLAVGERVLIDDGRLEGVVRSTGRTGAVVEVVRSPRKGLRLKEDRGINLPDTDLRLPMLSRRDRSELRTIVGLADSIGCSFVRSGDEMAYLSQVVASQGGAEVGLVAKVETEAAVFDLPDILASVTGAHPLGVMIARGDLAVELGWDRLAEYQQRILWFCQAAHVPVVWATQVLESMMRTGVPSRAELTDAAEAERAECVMLNKGEYGPEAVALLDSILTRMQDYVDHKTDLLPHLRHLD